MKRNVMCKGFSGIFRSVVYGVTNRPSPKWRPSLSDGSVRVFTSRIIRPTTKIPMMTYDVQMRHSGWLQSQSSIFLSQTRNGVCCKVSVNLEFVKHALELCFCSKIIGNAVIGASGSSIQQIFRKPTFLKPNFFFRCFGRRLSADG